MKRRWRRWGKWAGTGIALCIVAVWIASGWYSRSVVYKGRVAAALMRCGAGRIELFCSNMAVYWPNSPDGISASNYDLGPSPVWSRDWRPQIEMYRPVPSEWGWYCTIPLWNILALVLLPTAFLWYRDRRHPPGCCARCGYDLSGIGSGTCPECGPKP